MKTARTLTTALATITALAASAFAQGSLTPPGAPAPTMKTLQQVEPRTPLVAGSPGVSIGASGTITISQSGSYYLTGNLTVASGVGIMISASGVTVDLKGFTIRSTSATSSGDGINIVGSRVSIYNGHIESGTTYNGGSSGDQYTGPGFDYGIIAFIAASGIHIRDITVSGVRLAGIYVWNNDSLVESCIVVVAASHGICANTVCRCSAVQCGLYGIIADTVNDCTGRSTGRSTGSAGISAVTVANSFGDTSSTSANANGIDASGSVQNSYGQSAGGDGINAFTVANSYGYAYSTSADANGIEASGSVQNSYGKSNAGGDGIMATAVANSVGYAFSTRVSSEGIYASVAVQNSYGYSDGGDGIHSRGTVSYSYGNSAGTDAAADGIEAYIAVGCKTVGGEDIDHKYNMP